MFVFTLPSVPTDAALSKPQAEPLPRGPVELDEHAMSLVSGGSPHGTWVDEAATTQSPHGTW